MRVDVFYAGLAAERASVLRGLSGRKSLFCAGLAAIELVLHGLSGRKSFVGQRTLGQGVA